jgi:aminoacrylate peracid reductase
MSDRVILPAGTPAPLGPFSPAMAADNAIYTAGILAFDDNNDVVFPGDAAAQTRHVLETIKGILAAAGASMDDIVFNHVFLKDWADYKAINEVYASYFPNAKPARYCVQVGLVKPEALIEIASIAHLRPAP